MTVHHSKGKVFIELDVEGASWLASELPARDGFTRDVSEAVREAEEWHEAREDGPGIRIMVVMR